MHLTSQFKSDLYVFHHEYMTKIMMVFFVFVNTVSNGQLSSKFTWKGKKLRMFWVSCIAFLESSKDAIERKTRSFRDFRVRN